MTQQDLRAKLLKLKEKFGLSDKYYKIVRYGDVLYLENPVNFDGYTAKTAKVTETPFVTIVTFEEKDGYVIRTLFTDKNGNYHCLWKMIHVKEDNVYAMMKQFYSQTIMLWRDMCFEADSFEDIKNHYTYRRAFQALRDYRKTYRICEVDY